MSCITAVISRTPSGIIYATTNVTPPPPRPLTSFNLAFTALIGAINIFPSPSQLIEVVPRIIVQNGTIISSVDGTINGGSGPLRITVAPNRTDFTLSYEGTVWYLTLTPEGIAPRTVNNCFVTISLGGALPAPPTPGSKDTTIFIRSDRLCQVDYRVINPQGICDPCCNITSRVNDYRYYCVDFRCVLIDPSQEITFQLEQYALVRLMLSKLIFGEFDVNYLRRRYYEKFIRKVKACYPNFEQFFNGANPAYPYANYYLFFKK